MNNFLPPPYNSLLLVGDKKLDRFAKNCIRSWRKYLPDYQIKCWDNESLKNIDSRLVEQAIADRRWAFVADYVRRYALYNKEVYILTLMLYDIMMYWII